MIDPRLPIPPASDAYQKALSLRLYELFRGMTASLDSLRAGYLSAASNQRIAAPTTGSWAQGDQCRNSNPTELGSAGSKYIIVGWICVAAGSPGTWREMRNLTGN